jgi:hypothetical protein
MINKANAILGILIVSHPFCHQIDKFAWRFSQARGLASSSDSRLATRRNSTPISMYSLSRD